MADAFMELQQARHEADYSLSRPFSGQEVLDPVGQARDAFKYWGDVRKSAPAEAFLVALFANRHIRL